MELTFSQAITLLASLVFVGGFSAGLYEAITVMPEWFKDAPRSFLLVRARSPQVQKFWIPVQIVNLVLLIVALVVDWQSDSARVFLIVAGVCYIVALLTTVLYFVREVTYFMKVAADTPRDEKLQLRGRRWYVRSLLLRTTPLAIGSLAMLVALINV